jgi:hypothetical protein
MSVLKSLTFTSVPRAAAASPEQHRRNKLIVHLQEQLAMARAELDGTVYAVKKRRWELTEDGQKYLIEVDKRLKRWWSKAADGSLVLTVRWGSKPIEFEKGKAGIAVKDIPAVIATLDKLIAAVEAGEMDGMIASINKLRIVAKKRAA